MSSRTRAPYLAFVFSLVIAGAANASVLTIIEGESGSNSSLSASFIAEGSTPAGIQLGTVTTESLLFTITPPATLPADNFAVQVNTLVSQLLEPGTNQVSDELQLLEFTASLPPSVRFSFLSDTDTGSLGLCTSTCVDETGALQDMATVRFASGTTTFDTVTIRVQSDVERLPEPTTLALLPIVLAGLGLGRRKRAS